MEVEVSAIGRQELVEGKLDGLQIALASVEVPVWAKGLVEEGKLLERQLVEKNGNGSHEVEGQRQLEVYAWVLAHLTEELGEETPVGLLMAMTQHEPAETGQREAMGELSQATVEVMEYIQSLPIEDVELGDGVKDCLVSLVQREADRYWKEAEQKVLGEVTRWRGETAKKLYEREKEEGGDEAATAWLWKMVGDLTKEHKQLIELQAGKILAFFKGFDLDVPVSDFYAAVIEPYRLIQHWAVIPWEEDDWVRVEQVMDESRTLVLVLLDSFRAHWSEKEKSNAVLGKLKKGGFEEEKARLDQMLEQVEWKPDEKDETIMAEMELWWRKAEMIEKRMRAMEQWMALVEKVQKPASFAVFYSALQELDDYSLKPWGFSRAGLDKARKTLEYVVDQIERRGKRLITDPYDYGDRSLNKLCGIFIRAMGGVTLGMDGHDARERNFQIEQGLRKYAKGWQGLISNRGKDFEKQILDSLELLEQVGLQITTRRGRSLKALIKPDDSDDSKEWGLRKWAAGVQKACDDREEGSGGSAAIRDHRINMDGLKRSLNEVAEIDLPEAHLVEKLWIQLRHDYPGLEVSYLDEEMQLLIECYEEHLRVKLRQQKILAWLDRLAGIE